MDEGKRVEGPIMRDLIRSRSSFKILIPRRFERCKSSCKWLSLGFETKVCGGKERDVGFGELGEGGIGVVSKIGEIGGDVGEELFGDRGGE
ncbi:hypothetical protein Tco_0812408 [Tanacetum coccineum]